MQDEKIQFIADNLQESLDVEVKSWLNGLQTNSDKAKLAREIIALGNNDGGYIFIGFNDQGARFPEIAPEAGEIEAYTQDALASIVHRYVIPSCQCRLEFVTLTGSTQPHPVILVPGNHRTPLFAARGGPEGEIDSGKVYVRRPGGNSEAARSQDDWEKLIERLVKARQKELLGAIREVLNPSSKILAEEESTLEDWHAENYASWQQIIAEFDEDDPRRLENGHWAISFAITPFHTSSLTDLNAQLDKGMPKYSGWPPFTYLHRGAVRPKADGDSVIAYIGELDEGEQPAQRANYCDYWRVNRTGNGFLLRGMQEDRPEYLGNIYPMPQGPFFDWGLSIYRMAEVLKFIEALTAQFGEDDSSLQLLLVFKGAAGRRLENANHRYALHCGGRCNSDSLESRIETPVSEISTNLEELLLALLAPVYEQFDFAELPVQLVTNVVAEMLAFRT